MKTQGEHSKYASARGAVFQCRYDPDWTLNGADESLFRFLGYTREEFETRFENKMSGVIYPEDLAIMMNVVQAQLETGNLVFNENRLVCNGGAVKWIWISAERMWDKDGVPYFYCMFYDISRQKQAQEALESNERRYDAVLEQTRDIIYEWNCTTGAFYCSACFERRFGYAPPLDGFPQCMIARGLIHPEDEALLAEFYARIHSGLESDIGEFRIRTAAGNYLWCRISAAAILDGEGGLRKVVGMVSDIDEQKREMISAQEQVRRDALTGLYNRSATEDLVDLRLEDTVRGAAILVVDVDNFKGVNDTFGHIYGDKVLCDMAQSLASIEGPYDVAGRVGGDEFAFFLGGMHGQEEAEKCARQIGALFHRRVTEGEASHEISASIGIAFYPEDGTSYHALFEKADIAAYASKTNGKNCYTVYYDALAQNDGLMPRQTPSTALPPQEHFRDEAVHTVFRALCESRVGTDTVTLLLALAGELFRKSRVCIFERNQHGAPENTFEWCAPGIPAIQTQEDPAGAELLSYHGTLFDAQGIFFARDVARLPGESAHKNWLQARGTRACLFCRIGGVIVGFEDCVRVGSFSPEERISLMMIAQAVSQFLMIRRKIMDLEEYKSLTARLLLQHFSCIYMVDPETYQVLYTNEKLCPPDHLPCNGMLCYRAIRENDAPCADCPMRDLHEGCDMVTRELYHPHKGRWTRTTAERITRRNGQIVCLLSSVEITAQKDLEHQLTLYRSASQGGTFQMRLDEAFTLLYANDIFYQVHGYTPERMRAEIGNRCVEMLEPDQVSRVNALLEEAIAAGRPGAAWEMPITTGEGALRWIHVNVNFESADGGQIMRGFVIDCTERHQLLEDVERSEQRYRIALGQTALSVWEYDLKTRQLRLTDSAARDELRPRKLENAPRSMIEGGYIHQSSQAEFSALFDALFAGAEYAELDFRTRVSPDADWWWERIRYTTIFDATGHPVRAVGVGADITLQKEAELRYRQELQMRSVLTEGLLSSSRANLTENKVEYLQRVEAPDSLPIRDMTYDALVDLGGGFIISAEDRLRYVERLSRTALLQAFDAGCDTVSTEYRRSGPEGHLRWVSATAKLLRSAENGDLYAYGTIRDISAQKAMEQSLKRRAEIDPLTGAYNQETTMELMQDAMDRALREQKDYVLLLVNIDNFSAVVHQNGYEAADHILWELGTLLQSKFWGEKIVGRLYGDELSVWVGNNPDREHVRKTAEEIRETICMPYMFPDAAAPVSVSMGIAYSGTCRSLAELLRQAQAALTMAKLGGKNQCVIFSTQELSANAGDAPQGEHPIRFSGGNIDQILLRCAFALSSSAEFPRAIGQVLRDVMAYYRADRVSLLELSAAPAYQARWYDALEDGAAARREVAREVLLGAEGRWLDLLCGTQRVETEDIATLAEKMPSLYARLHHTGVRSAYVLPLERDGKVLGYLGVNNALRHCGDLALLEALRHFAANELVKYQMREQQVYLGEHDALTGLLNRNSYIRYLSALEPESLIALGVASVDINGLKRMNNQYGHAYGDALVKATAAALTDALDGAHIFRFAGDEFLALCENRALECFRAQLETLRRDMEQKYPGCIALGSAWADNDINPERLIRHADERMVVAKQAYYLDGGGGGKYDPTMLQKLVHELDAGRYEMYLQPKARPQSGEIAGAEALVRYRNAENGIVAPDRFIPQLERGGVIRYVDLFMFEEVCKTLHRWRAAGKPLMPISLNFSRMTLLEEQLMEQVDLIWARYGVPRAYIEIEITESVGAVERETIVRIGEEIVRRGYRLSLDDFGSKYSNLSILSAVHFDVLKLDKSLVNDLFSNENTRVVVKNVLATCRELGIESVAEGVETKEQLQILREMDCDYAQGYYFNKPIPRVDFEQNYL